MGVAEVASNQGVGEYGGQQHRHQRPEHGLRHVADGDGASERGNRREYAAWNHYGPRHPHRVCIAPERTEGAKHAGELAGAEQIGGCCAGLGGE